MRKKIARRKRRYILSKGAKITSEEREDGFFTARVDYLGWHIASSNWDELSAYQGVIACFPVCEEEPRTEEED